MNRIQLIQKFIDAGNYARYLEIGVNRGSNFMPVRIRYKVAVDPLFKIPLSREIKWRLLYPWNNFNKYFKMTSDDYFLLEANVAGLFDIVFIDGLHTFRQSLMDALNSLNCLNGPGVIVMHDCNPITESSGSVCGSLDVMVERSKLDSIGEWCGEVWKTIVYLKTLSSAIEVFVLDADYGLGVLKILDPSYLPSSIDENLFNSIDKLSYEDFNNQREEVINLKPVSYLEQFLQRDVHLKGPH